MNEQDHMFMDVLMPIIKHNYAQRRAKAEPDKWHWADALASMHGYWVDADGNGRHGDYSTGRRVPSNPKAGGTP